MKLNPMIPGVAKLDAYEKIASQVSAPYHTVDVMTAADLGLSGPIYINEVARQHSELIDAIFRDAMAGLSR